MTSKQRILAELRPRGKKVTGWQLALRCNTTRFGARIYEMRREGIDIKTKMKNHGGIRSYEYQLKTLRSRIDFTKCRLK